MAYPLSPRKHENKVPTVSKSAPKAHPARPNNGQTRQENAGRVGESLLPYVFHQALDAHVPGTL